MRKRTLSNLKRVRIAMDKHLLQDSERMPSAPKPQAVFRLHGSRAEAGHQPG